jgi:hypothetical protein
MSCCHRVLVKNVNGHDIIAIIIIVSIVTAQQCTRVFLVRDLSGVLHLKSPSLPWSLPLSFFTFNTSIACI